MARFLLPIISTETTTPLAFPPAGLTAGGARLSRPPGAQVGRGEQRGPCPGRWGVPPSKC